MYKYYGKPFKPQEYDHFPVLTNNQIREEVDRCWDFLKQTHSLLQEGSSKDSYNVQNMDLAIEIRPLRSDMGQGQRYVRTHYIYRFNEKEKKRFYNYCVDLFKPKDKKKIEGKLQKVDPYYMPFCLYFSLYLVDTTVVPIVETGAEGKVKLAANTAHCTQILSVDLDGIGEEQYLKYKYQLTELGLGESLDVFTGHGYQLHFLLDQPTTNLKALEKFNKAIRAIGIDADEKVIDCSRVLRLGFFNSKTFLEGDKYYQNSPVYSVEEVSTSDRRYSIEEIFKALGSEYEPNKRDLTDRRFNGLTLADLRDYPFADEHIGNLRKSIRKEQKEAEKSTVKAQKATSSKVNKVKENKATKDDINIDALDLKDLYPMLEVDELAHNVKKMLYGFRENLANNMLMFLSLRLRLEEYSEENIVEAMCILKTLDTYDYAWDIEDSLIRKEVNRFYHSDYTNVPEGSFERLEQVFGKLSLEKDDLVIDKNTKIKIPNNLFARQVNETKDITEVADFTPAAFEIWLAMLLHNHHNLIRYEEEKEFTQRDLLNITSIKQEKTVREALKVLIKLKRIEKKTIVLSEKGGKKYVYSLSDKANFKGVSRINTSTIRALLLEVKYEGLSQRALMTYCYIRFRMGAKDSIEVSQATIGSILGVNQPVVSKILKELDSRDLLIKHRTGFKKNNRYTLTT